VNHFGVAWGTETTCLPPVTLRERATSDIQRERDRRESIPTDVGGEEHHGESQHSRHPCFVVAIANQPSTHHHRKLIQNANLSPSPSSLKPIKTSPQILSILSQKLTTQASSQRFQRSPRRVRPRGRPHQAQGGRAPPPDPAQRDPLRRKLPRGDHEAGGPRHAVLPVREDRADRDEEELRLRAVRDDRPGHRREGSDERGEARPERADG